ncbi:MAG TPA: methyl-accepting chemotaxis protein [Gemmatimonadaceae bacterium]|jgi:methyl-accepting chemotaxis protein
MKWFVNLRTVVKLTAAFSLVAAVMAFNGYLGVARMGDINARVGTMYSEELRGLSAIKEANVQMYLIRAQLRQMILDTDAADLQQDKQQVAAGKASLDSAIAEFDKTVENDDVKAKVVDLKAAKDAYYALADSIERYAMVNQNAQATAALAVGKQASTRFIGLANQLSTQTETLAAKEYDASNSIYSSSRNRLLLVVLIGVVVSIGFGVFLARLISRPLAEAAARADKLRGLCITNLREAAEKLAAGDLTVKVATGTTLLEIDTKDEIGDIARAINGIIKATQGTVAAFETAVESMRVTMSEVRSAADNTANGSQQLKAASQEISTGAQEQASSLEETAASLEEMTATIKQNADNAQQAAQLAGGARDVAEKGGQVVKQAVVAMGEINQSSKQIGDIITTIDEIAFQTNLLALNAAVEAARAGQQGRGFAVVAGEVRKLAQRSATAAKEIKGLIQDSLKKVENGSSLVNESGKTLSEIVLSVKRVTDIVAEIAAASKEQATGIDQLNRAVIQMDQVTQQNASQTEELSGTAESLASQADQLQATVSRFQLGGAVAPSIAHHHVAPKAAPKAALARPIPVPSRLMHSTTRRLSANGNGNGNGHRSSTATLDGDFEEF